MTATLRTSRTSSAFRKRPRSIRSDWMRRISGWSPITLKAPVRLSARDVVAAAEAAAAGCGATTSSTSGTRSRMAATSAFVSAGERPAGKPANGFCVRCVHRKKLLVAESAKSRIAPFSSPAPDPIITISRKMPQKTPNAASSVRARLRSRAARTSCQWSRSSSRRIYSSRSATDGVDLRGAARRQEAGQGARDHQEADREDGRPEVDRRVAEGGRVAQAPGEELQHRRRRPPGRRSRRPTSPGSPRASRATSPRTAWRRRRAARRSPWCARAPRSS